MFLLSNYINCLATKKQFVMLFERNPLKTFSVQRFSHSDSCVDWESADSVQVTASCCITSSSLAPDNFFYFFFWGSPEILQKCHADLGMNRLWIVTWVVKPSYSCFPAIFLPYISGAEVKFGHISHSFLLATNLPTMKLCWLCVRTGPHLFR